MLEYDNDKVDVTLLHTTALRCEWQVYNEGCTVICDARFIIQEAVVRQLSIENILSADTKKRVCVDDKKIPSKEAVEVHGNIQEFTVP
jgi:hypothetical protein